MKNDLQLALQAMREAYPTVQEIKRTSMVLAFMGLLFDQYCADHKIGAEEKFALLMELVDASKFVHNELGPLNPTVTMEVK